MKNKGFTLVELMVVVAIIGILTAIVLPSYKNSNKQLALQRSAQKISLDLRRVQNMAMSAKEFQGAVPKGGYGIYFEKDSESYFLFVATDIGSDPENPVYGYNNNPSDKIEEISLETGVKISSNDGYIVFTPPDPNVTIGPGEPEPSELTITLCLEDNCLAKTKTISINKVGMIGVGD